MATLTTETWTGSNGAAWPTGWSTPAAGTALIQNNRGVITPAGTGYKNSRSFLTRLAARADTEVYVEVFWASPNQENYADITVRGQQDTNYYPSGYFVQLAPTGTEWVLANGYGTGFYGDQHVAFTYTAGATYGVRLQVIGTTIRARVWNLSSAEPSTWGATLPTTASNDFATGYVALANQSGNTTNPAASYDNLTVTDAAAGNAYTGTLGITGAGTLARSGSPRLVGSQALTGSGTLSSTGAPRATGTQAYTGAGTFASTGAPRFTETRAYTGTGGLTYNGASAYTGTINVAGSGYLGTSGTVTLTDTVAGAGTGFAAFDGTANAAGAINLPATGQLETTGTATFSGALNLTGSGTFTPEGKTGALGQYNATASGTLSLTGRATNNGALDLNGVGYTQFIGGGTTGGMVANTGTGSLALTGRPSNFGQLSLTSTGTLTSAGQVAAASALAIAGTATLTLTEKHLARNITVTVTPNPRTWVATNNPRPTTTTQHTRRWGAHGDLPA